MLVVAYKSSTYLDVFHVASGDGLNAKVKVRSTNVVSVNDIVVDDDIGVGVPKLERMNVVQTRVCRDLCREALMFTCIAMILATCG